MYAYVGCCTVLYIFFLIIAAAAETENTSESDLNPRRLGNWN